MTTLRAFERGWKRIEIEVVGRAITVRELERGVVVDEQSRTCSSELNAKWDADRLCREQAARGFERVAGEDIVPPTQGELLDALRRDPDALDTYTIYADWLLERGDPWGQLVAVQHALATLARGTSAERRAELEREEVTLRFKHAARLWGALGETITNVATQTYACDLIDAAWRCGFLQGVRIAYNSDHVGSLVRELRPLEIAVLLRTLSMIDTQWPAGSLEALGEQPWPALRELEIVTDRVGRHVVTSAHRVADVLAAMPALDTLTIGGTSETDALCVALAAKPLASTIERIALYAGEFTETGIEALAGAQFGALRSLRLSGSGPATASARLARLAPKVVVELRAYQQGDDDDD